jgi:hypothetical protein
MQSVWTRSLALIAALALHSHALFGIGGHWAPVMGLEVESRSGSIMPDGSANPDRIHLDTRGSSGLNGFGAKFWIDALPFVDLEVSSNVQFGYYDAYFILNGTDTTKLDFDLGVAGIKDKPFFARMYGDAAVLYPFFSLPMVKFQAGAGLSYGLATQTMSASFARRALTRAEDAGDFNAGTATEEEITDALVDAIKDEGMVSGAGFFLQAGTKVSPPMVPVAVYADAKYRFAGYKPDLVRGSDLTLEMGAAFAF